jgi:SAM-dependent methyltransferase
MASAVGSCSRFGAPYFPVLQRSYRRAGLCAVTSRSYAQNKHSVFSTHLTCQSGKMAMCTTFFDKSGRDWNTAWKDNNTPWETGSVTPGLKSAMEDGYCQNLIDMKHALVPGCGTGHDVEYLKTLGRFESVVGLDMSQIAIDKANENHGHSTPTEPGTTVSYVCDSYFDYNPQYKFDVIFDYLFFSALDIHLRERWADATARLLTEGSGVLITKLFPLFNPESDSPAKLMAGPPYLVRVADYKEVLIPRGFTLCHTETVNHT